MDKGTLGLRYRENLTVKLLSEYLIMTDKLLKHFVFCLLILLPGLANANSETTTGVITKIRFYSEDASFNHAKNYTLFKISNPIPFCDWLHLIPSQFNEESRLFSTKENVQQIRVVTAGNSTLKHEYENERICKIRRIEYL